MLLDMQSFYASIEKLSMHDGEKTPLVVAGDPRFRSGVILAACPLAKKEGVKTGEPLWQAQQKYSDLLIRKPRMQKYIDISIGICAILEETGAYLEPYSIDEFFIDTTDLLKRSTKTPFDVAFLLKQRIYRSTGLHARFGIGENKTAAKLACDNFAKKNADGIFTLNQSNIGELWELPVGKMWGIGNRMEKNLSNMGIRTIGQLARHPLSDLKKRWGINGELIYQTAHLVDASPVTEDSHEGQKAISHGMTLPKNLHILSEMLVPLRELCEEVAFDARKKGYMGSVVSVGVSGGEYDLPTGFHRQCKLSEPTNDGKVIFEALKKLYKEHWTGYPIRRLGVGLTQLTTDTYRQLNLFEPIKDNIVQNSVMDHIKEKYGKDAIMYASSISEAGQVQQRAKKIGGHYK